MISLILSRISDNIIGNYRSVLGSKTMAVSYKKLFHLLLDKDLSPTDLMKKAGFSGNIIMRLKRDEYVSLQSIESICQVLECGVDDILEFKSKK